MTPQELVAAAMEVRERAYAPYSNFRVGAAVLTSAGELFAGANVENASYGLTICAERVAIGSAVAAGARKVSMLAVVSKPGACMCGACRQVLSEFAEPDAMVMLASEDGSFETVSFAELLPRAFDPRDLEK
ncbi:MAG: cytidine deaminase [Planctomycetota bacterium]|jgi:cytidine deaminase